MIIVGAVGGVRIGQRMRGIGNEFVQAYLFIGRCLVKSSPSRRIGFASQEVRLRFGASKRPGVFVAPDVFSHDQEADGLFAIDAIVDAADVVIHPAQNQLVVIDGGAGTEFAAGSPRFFLAAVRPRTNDGARTRVFFAAFLEQPVEIGGGAVGTVGFVVPAREVEDRGVD